MSSNPDSLFDSTYPHAEVVVQACRWCAQFEEIITKIGRLLSVLIATLISILLSLSITYLTYWLNDTPASAVSSIVSVAIPIIIAAPVTWLGIGLLLSIQENSRTIRAAQADVQRSEKLAALGSVVVGLAHQISTPIGNCVCVASALQDRARDLGEALSVGMRRSALESFVADASYGHGILMRNLQRIADLVEGFKQIEEQQRPESRRHVDLQDLIRKTLSAVRPAYTVNMHRLVMDVRGQIEMDSFPDQIEQLLGLLIHNSVVHGFEGRKSGTIQVSAIQKNHRTVRLSVQDNGGGIPVQHQPRIFEPFFSTKLGQGGSGLGLAVVKSIVERVLGGNIWVVSRVGSGTKITIDIPNNAPDIPKESQFMLSGNYSLMQSR